MADELNPLQETQEEGDPITRDNVLSKPAIATLGLVCGRALQALGVVTLIVRPDGTVGYVSPQDVYIEKNAAVCDPEHEAKPFRYVRPILSDGKPHYVAWKDATLWEIAFEESEASEPTNEPETNAP